MSAGKPLRLALVGAGGIAQRHLDAADERPDVLQFVSVCDPSENAIAHARERVPSIRTYQNVEQLVEAGGFDAAVVATPHYLHFDQASVFARAGYSVLVEKPLVTTTEDMRKLHTIADASGAVIVAGQTRRHTADAMLAREAMSDPRDFGKLKTFDIQSLQDIRSFTSPDRPHWLLDGKLAGGGVTISNAIHQIDLVRFITGADYSAVMAAADFEEPFINGAESRVSAVLELTNGAHGTLHADYLAARSPFSEAMVLVCEHGSLVQHAERLGDYNGPLSVSSSHGVRSTDFSQQHSGWHPLLSQADGAGKPQDSFTRQLLRFAAVLRGEEKPISPLAENFNTIAVIEAIIQSARSGKRVEVAKW